MCAPSGRTFLAAPLLPEVIGGVLVPSAAAAAAGAAAVAASSLGLRLKGLPDSGPFSFSHAMCEVATAAGRRWL